MNTVQPIRSRVHLSYVQIINHSKEDHRTRTASQPCTDTTNRDRTQDRIKFTPARSIARRRPDSDYGPGLDVEV
jgi:hypothetical protein